MSFNTSFSQKRAIRPIGTIGRVALGGGMIYLAVTNLGQPEWGLEWYAPVLGLVGFPAASILLVKVWRGMLQSEAPLSATGPVGFCVNLAIGFALFSVPFTRDATLLFYGVSLLLAALRGYAGCEVMAISNWLLRRDDQVGCVVFSPIDAAEKALTGKIATG